MNMRSNLVGLALASLGLLGLSSLNARAAIICNEVGDCWHAQETYVYPPTAHVIIHPDTWHWGDSEHFVWKEHPGRGYWSDGRWEAF